MCLSKKNDLLKVVMAVVIVVVVLLVLRSMAKEVELIMQVLPSNF